MVAHAIAAIETSASTPVSVPVPRHSPDDLWLDFNYLPTSNNRPLQPLCKPVALHVGDNGQLRMFEGQSRNRCSDPSGDWLRGVAIDLPKEVERRTVERCF
jgi:hypothetical protein